MAKYNIPIKVVFAGEVPIEASSLEAALKIVKTAIRSYEYQMLKDRISHTTIDEVTLDINKVNNLLDIQKDLYFRTGKSL